MRCQWWWMVVVIRMICCACEHGSDAYCVGVVITKVMVQRQLVTLAKMAVAVTLLRRLGERVYWWRRLSSAVADAVVAVAAGKRRLVVVAGLCRSNRI